MSRTVAEVREQLVVEENLFKIEVENNAKRKIESEEKEDKVFKRILITAILSHLAFFPIFYCISPAHNIFTPLTLSSAASFVLFIIMIVVYTVFFSSPTPMIYFDGMHEEIDYLKKIRKLELELLVSSTGAKIIQIKNDELGKEWHNMILEIDGKAKEYYVYFPRDEKGYASVEYYEFIPGTTRSKR